MNRFLGYFNLTGVIALAILCGVQWQANSQVNLKAIELEKTGIAQLMVISDQDKHLKNDASKLDDLHDRLDHADRTIREDEANLATCSRERRQLTIQRDQLKDGLKQWMAGVADATRSSELLRTKFSSSRRHAIRRS